MSKTIFAPPGTTHVSFDREQYVVSDDGSVTVPDNAAAVLLSSHGFGTTASNTRYIMAPVANDLDMVVDDDNDNPSPSDFTKPMSAQDMKAYLRSQGVGIPKNITVGELRSLVEATYVSHLSAAAANETAEQEAKAKIKADEEAKAAAEAAKTAAT